ncbi:MAG TPA: BrnA antitoxin family protein [Roseiarcus sp.]|nr:BrnA antitoxin family protein [Roseiarcus sp.]
MQTKKPGPASGWVDPDDAPILSREWFVERADLHHGDKIVRRGRPKSDNPKEAVNLRLDADVLEFFRKPGPGWQTRINEELRKAAGL